jgi:hypothetical protein
MMPEPNRVRPALAVQHMKTYAISQPMQSHFRKASCAEVECDGYTHGWMTRVPAGSEMAQYILSKQHGRHFTETTGHSNLAAGEQEFLFPPGQSCFRASEHRIFLDRPAFFVVRDGDWRGNPTGRTRQHTRAEDWVDDFRTHQDRIAQAHQRG